MSRQQYSPNPSPMVPDPVELQHPSPQIRSPTIPGHSLTDAPPPTPGWAQPQNPSMNAFQRAYPGVTPYPQFAQPPGSYYTPPVGLPNHISSPPEAGHDGFSTNWLGWTQATQSSPYNGPPPHTAFSMFQQPLPAGVGPHPGPGFGQWPPGAVPVSTPASWHQPGGPAAAAAVAPPPPGSWGPPSAGGWNQPLPGWSGSLPPGAQTPWVGGGGTASWHQPPPSVVQAPVAPPAIPQPPAIRDRSNEGLDHTDKFAVGVGYGPVLTPLILRIVNAALTINPLLTGPDASLDNAYLKWNMLFSASHCVRSDDPPQRSWSRGRNQPATHPRLTELKIISRTFPWTISVRAADDKAGVTCGEIIDRLDDFLHKNLKREDAEMDTPAHKTERDAAYYHNRSTALGVPGGRLGDGLRRLDWLCKDTMFGGLALDEGHVLDAFSAVVPGIVSLVCTTRYPLTEQEMKEQQARENEEERLKELEHRARAAEQRALQAEARERHRLAEGTRSRSRSSRSASTMSPRSPRSPVSRTEDAETSTTASEAGD